MANKCTSCGKFHSSTDGVVCGICAGSFHRECAGLLEGVVVAADWACLNCKRKRRQSNYDDTPVKGAAAPYDARKQTVEMLSTSGEIKISQLCDVGDEAAVMNNTANNATLEFHVDLALEIRAFREELGSLKTHCSKEIQGVCGEFKELREEISSFKAAIFACNRRLEDMEKRVEAMETNYASSKSPAIESLEQAIEDLKMELQDRDQDLLANDIQISHIPETKAENPIHLVKVIAVKLGMTLDERDIVSAVRVGALRPAAGAAEGAAAAAARARPLAVRLARRATRDELLRAMRVRRGLTTADMGLEGEPKRFYINERLTKLNRQLFGKARDLGSLGTGHDELTVTITNSLADVVAINETWLRDGEEGRAPRVAGYRLRHVARPRRLRSRGGGVGFFVRQGLSARTLPHPPATTVEQMWIRLNVNGKKIIIGTAYRPDWVNVDIFLDAMTDSITSFKDYDRIVLLGDFNIDFSKDNCASFRSLENFLNTLNLTQHVREPTHFTDTSQTTIDLICTDARVKDVNVLYRRTLGRHAFVTVILDIKKTKAKPRTITYRPIKDIDIELFNKDLDLLDWDKINRLDDVSDMVRCLNQSIISLFDLHAPEKTVVVRETPHPWITDNIRFMMQLRDDAYDEYRKTKTDSKRQYYKDLKHQVNVALYFEKKVFFERILTTTLMTPRHCGRT
ncbi:unnamed protein product [Plutella xylostella]|uniref:(diamondback moth) hypothetical protein n=1 Tax=Plutella xylostella TaxID=51655 RepID=A0A8S4G654_PLUXY|nr:unnamed protein product [Plutella xylostella]